MRTVSCLLICIFLLPGVLIADPSGWLSSEGQEASWVKGTERHRELLGQLDPENPTVKKWLPSVKYRCSILSRFRKIDKGGQWKTHIYAEYTRKMLEALAKGEPPFRALAGTWIPYVYWSDHIQMLTGTRVQIPPEYDPNREYQLFMYYKMGGSMIFRAKKPDGSWKKWIHYSHEGAELSPPMGWQVIGKDKDTFHAWSALSSQVKGRLGQAEEFEEITAALTRDFSISPDRLFATGYSDGGFNSLTLGCRYPHLVAGIFPNVANWQYYNAQYFGFRNVPVLVEDGWGDAGYINENIGRFLSLSNIGFPFEVFVNHHGHQHKHVEEQDIYDFCSAWAKKQRRNPWPKHVSYSTWNLRWHRAYWVYIEQMIEPALNCLIDVQVRNGNVIAVSTQNIARYRLELNDKLVDPAKSIKVTTDGKVSYEGPFKATVTVVLKEIKGAFTKSPTCYGDMAMAAETSTYAGDYDPPTKLNFKVPGRTWHFVKPDKLSEAGKPFLGWVPSWYQSADKMTEDNAGKKNIFLIGNPFDNSLIAKVADKLPVKFEKGRFSIGNKVYDKPHQCVRFIFPNPYNPEKKIIIFAYNDLAAAGRTGFGGQGRGFFGISAWKHRTTDAQVFGTGLNESVSFVSKLAGSIDTDYYVFNPAWQAPDEIAIGEAAAFFDQVSLHYLKAEAIREAAGTDVGIYYGYPPGYCRLKTCLEKGPLTINDIAMTNKYPEYIITFELTGKMLKERLKEFSFTTICADKNDSRYADGSMTLADISDEKTYTLASDYGVVNGGRTYGIAGNKADKKPDNLLHAASEDEFFGKKNMVRTWYKPKQTDIEVARAVIDYIRKKGKVSPVKITGDLNRYLTNPEQNEYPAYDWAHLAVPVDFKDPVGGGVIKRREVIDIGVRPAGKDGGLTPRGNSKKFSVLDLTKSDLGLVADMSKLDLGTALKLRAGKVLAQSLDGQCEAGKAVLAAKGSGDDGEIRMFSLKLENTGAADIQVLFALRSTIGTRHQGWFYYPQHKQFREAKGKTFFYRGMFDQVGKYKRKHFAHGIGILHPEGVPSELPKKLFEKGMGYAMGSYAYYREFTIPAGQTVNLPVFAVSAVCSDRKKLKNVDIHAVLESVRTGLLKAAEGL